MSDQNGPDKEVRHTTVVEKGGGGGPLAWIAVIVVVALIVFGIWYFVSNMDAVDPPEAGDSIEIEQEAPDVDIDIEVPSPEEGGEDAEGGE